MDCQKCLDTMALLLMGEDVDESTAAEARKHLLRCEQCSQSTRGMNEIVVGLKDQDASSPSKIETLQMENEILRRFAEESLREGARRRQRAPLRMLVRLAAAIVLLALGYLVRPSVAGLVSPPGPTARVTEPVMVREDVRRAMKSGYRFSGQGLAVIARGAAALKEVAPAEAGR